MRNERRKRSVDEGGQQEVTRIDVIVSPREEQEQHEVSEMRDSAVGSIVHQAETGYEVRVSADDDEVQAQNPMMTPEEREPAPRETPKETPEFTINKDLTELRLPNERTATREISNVDFSPHSNMFDDNKGNDEDLELEPPEEQKGDFSHEAIEAQNETIINVDTNSNRDDVQQRSDSEPALSDSSNRPPLNKDSYKAYITPDLVKFAKKSNRGEMETHLEMHRCEPPTDEYLEL